MRAIATVLVVAVVTSLAPRASAAECGSDSDCPGDLVCEAGRCLSTQEIEQRKKNEQEIRERRERELEQIRAEDEREKQQREAAEKRERDAREAKARQKEEERQRKEAEERRESELSALRRPTKIAGGAMLGGSAVALIVGVATGVSAQASKRNLDADCIDKVCPRSSASDVDSMQTSATVSTISFVAAVALAAGGIYFLVRSANTKLPEPQPETGSIFPFRGTF